MRAAPIIVSFTPIEAVVDSRVEKSSLLTFEYQVKCTVPHINHVGKDLHQSDQTEFQDGSKSANPYYPFRCLLGLPAGRSRPERRLNIAQITKSSKWEANTWIEALKAINLFPSS